MNLKNKNLVINKRMRRIDITSKYTLTVLNKRGITDEFISKFDTLEDLRKGLHNLQKLDWAKNNKEYFKKAYEEKLKPRFQKKYQENKERLKEGYKRRVSIVKLFKVLPFPE